MSQLIVGLVFLAVLLYVVFVFVREYREATGTTWHRFVEAAGDSATLLWSKFMIVVGSLAGSATFLADYLGVPQVDNIIKAVLNPYLVPVYILFVSWITIRARRRSM